ncbi:MAG: chromosomal replication initiator protein DnaA [Proteobacteria bacterium]|nr:chromosomal replication initiator protein DnaA [Pseudomonadota bacterium]
MNKDVQTYEIKELPTDTVGILPLWTEALGRLKLGMSDKYFEMWLDPIEVVELTGDLLVLRAPNLTVRSWFEQNFAEQVVGDLRSLGQVVRIAFAADRVTRDEHAPEPAVDRPSSPIPSLGERGTLSLPIQTFAKSSVHDVPPANPFVAPFVAPFAPAPATPQPIETSREAATQRVVMPDSPSLNPKYTFDTFVAGSSNQLAFAASQAAASSYPPKYNPVFICGPAGLGKTHLLHAIGHQQLANRPDTRILYISSERFINEYVGAVQTGRMAEFRRTYREGIDVLLVDDVQFLSGKESTQIEFFYTFNALYDSQKQIVLTADRKPNEIRDLTDRLSSRFSWGLLADIEPPELEVRLAILRKKAAVEAVVLPDDVAMYIAQSIKSNVRELEGALIRLAAYASLSKRRIDLDFAQETLGSMARPREIITVESIIKTVATYYGIKPNEIKSDKRTKSLAHPRAVAMYLSRQHTKDSYPDLARAFGGKHHTTVISAVQKIAEQIKEDSSLRSEIHAVETQILR